MGLACWTLLYLDKLWEHDTPETRSAVAGPVFSICCSATQPLGPSEGRSAQRVRRDSFMELLKSLFLWTLGSGWEGKAWLSLALDCLLCSVVRRHITHYPLSCSSGTLAPAHPALSDSSPVGCGEQTGNVLDVWQTCLKRERSTACWLAAGRDGRNCDIAVDSCQCILPLRCRSSPLLPPSCTFIQGRWTLSLNETEACWLIQGADSAYLPSYTRHGAPG